MKALNRIFTRAGLCLAIGMAAGGAMAQATDTPVGLWKNIDDKTGLAKGLIRISESGGVLTGKIEKVLTKGEEDAKCEQCEGELKDKPIAGMTIIRGLKKGEEYYEGGTILDPNNGKTYKARLKLIDGGKKLEMRGYIGAPMLGRTQTWVREQ